jgi:drug/metabolite transporter (DMT)-like permease
MSSLLMKPAGRVGWAPRFTAALAQPVFSGIALGLLAVLIWGSYLALARAGVSAGLAASDIAFIRYGVAGLAMAPWLFAHNPATLAGVGWRRGLILTALVGPLFILIGVGGYMYAPLAHGAVLQPAALTLGGMGLAALVLKDRLTRARGIGGLIIVLGLAVIAGPGLLTGGGLAPLGDTMFVAAGLMWAGFTILSRRWGISPLGATAAVSVISLLIYTPFYLGFVGFGRLLAQPWSVLVPQIVVQGLLSGVVAVIAYSAAVQRLGAGRAAAFPALVPAVAIILGIPIAEEWPTALQLSGLVVVTLGLGLASGLMKHR